MIDELKVLLQAMREAGQEVLRLQESGFSMTTKANNDIVTKADLLANDIFRTHLLGTFPGYGWLSEESVDDAERLRRERVWIIDPIDGTREFASGVPEYALSVALVERGDPIVSAVFNPAANELFHAVKGQGAWLGDVSLQCDSYYPQDHCLLLASRSEYSRGEWQRFEQTYPVKQVGSIAYKLALIAAGKAGATFSLGPKNEWDIAAGVLLVREAGGVVTDARGQRISFNHKNTLVPGIIACVNEGVQKDIMTLIENTSR